MPSAKHTQHSFGCNARRTKLGCLSQVLRCWETVTRQRKAQGQRGHWEVGIVSKQCRWDWDQAERGKETGRRKRSCIKAINHLGWILSLKCNLYNIVCISKKCRRCDGRGSGSVGCVWACVCVGCSGIPNIFIILFAKTLTCGFFVVVPLLTNCACVNRTLCVRQWTVELCTELWGSVAAQGERGEW